MSLQRSKAETEQFERGAIVAALSWLCDPLRTMAEEIKTGDTVRLKSGGPVMTLGAKMDVGGYQCLWFSGNELMKGLFRLEQLEKAEPDKEWQGEGLH
jgi:uncharacterized protein YodC (DUF2158 family)